MKICLAQTRSVKGDIEANINQHKKMIDAAITKNADTIIFPELSLTNYEPKLAAALAIDKYDERLNDFQTLSDTNKITIGVGAPTKAGNGICISMIIFQPNRQRELYSKKYLHADEEPYFVSGENLIETIGDKTKAAAIAICYEVFVPEHAENILNNNAGVYIASVAKSAKGVEKAMNRMPDIAMQFSVPVLMCNCVGECEDFTGAGNSAVWNNEGQLLNHLDESNEGLLLYDIDAGKPLNYDN